MSILHVVFKVGEAEYVVAAADVLQMESYTGATHVPGALPYVCGVVQVRGRVVPVVDLRSKLSSKTPLPAHQHLVIIRGRNDKLIGLAVDEVRDVVNVDTNAIEQPGDVAGVRSPGVVRSPERSGSS